MEIDFTALASRVAARAEVLGCLILSQDGLVLGSFPPNGERDVSPAWVRFSGMGEPERGFITFAEETWAYVAHGGYAAFAVAVRGARPGILLDLLEQVLMEVGESRDRRDAIRQPETVNLPSTPPVERPAPPPAPVPVPAEPQARGESEEAAPTPPPKEDIDRVALAREFAHLLQENPPDVEDGR